MSNVEHAGIAQVIFTVEANPDDSDTAIVTYWIQDGTKIGTIIVPRDDR